ncbi:MAG TPA: NAD(P)-dependent oxidoreductase, partial [bacterium]|nr:NAD(P)-dependent oxidoreductase [bacterium]
HLTEKILACGHQVKILSRRHNQAVSEFEKRGAEISIGEFSDINLLKKSVDSAETVVHLAGATKTLTENDMFKVNVDYTKNLLEACNGKNIHFVYMSSQAAAGPAISPDKPVVESDTPAPLTWYGKSKLAAENEVSKWGEENHNEFTIIRPPSVYGPGEKDIFACFRLMKKHISFSMGFKEKQLSVIYVKDLVSATVHLIENVKPSGKTYFASSDGHYSWEELFSAIATAMGKNKYLKIKLPEITAVPVAFFSESIAKITKTPALLNFQKIIEMKQDYWICSNYLLKSTGWEPSYSLEKGMKETVEWYLANNWL